MTISEISSVASNAGFEGQDLVTAVAIALAESGGNPQAWGDAGIGEGSFGLWQISSKYHPEYGPDFTALYDPQTNANAAFAIYSAAGNSFLPWSTFKLGRYQEFMDSAAAAIATAVTQNPGTSAGVLILGALVLYLLVKKA
jgi:hypothetical protein